MKNNQVKQSRRPNRPAILPLMVPLMGLLLLSLFLIAPHPAAAADEVDDLKEQLRQLNDQMQSVQKKLEEMEKKSIEKEDDLEYMNERLDKAAFHAATDKVALGVELRTEAQSIHYENMLAAPPALMGGFFSPPAAGGFNGATRAQIQQGMAQMAKNNMIPPPAEADVDNDIIYTNRFRLNLSSKLNDQLSFGGRLAAYKVFGDSTEVKFNRGALGDVTFDGNTASLPHGDTLRVERAFFNFSKDLGSVPISFSLGRRPSTEGAPMEYRNFSTESGSPLASIINWQFDGASLNFGLEDVTSVPGATFKLCYGVGFEGDWGNSYSLSVNQAEVDDVHLFGVISNLYDNGLTNLRFSYAHAWDVTDGFAGLTVMPFIVSKADMDMNGEPEYYFEPNSGGFISRMEPSTNIGDWDAATLLLRHNFIEQFDKDIDFFLSTSWSHTSPSQVSKNPFYEMMGQGLLSSNGDLEDRDGYSLYAGAIFPMPYDARFGLEYNYGSKYWFNFTGAEDSLVGSKLAVRGHVFEGYYHQPVFGKNFFFTLGGQYYDYEYTGSGNPLGEPVKISEATAFDAFNGIVDKVWLGYLSATVRF